MHTGDGDEGPAADSAHQQCAPWMSCRRTEEESGILVQRRLQERLRAGRWTTEAEVSGQEEISTTRRCWSLDQCDEWHDSARELIIIIIIFAVAGKWLECRVAGKWLAVKQLVYWMLVEVPALWWLAFLPGLMHYIKSLYIVFFPSISHKYADEHSICFCHVPRKYTVVLCVDHILLFTSRWDSFLTWQRKVHNLHL